MRNLSIGFSVTRENNLVHFSETKDIYFFDTRIDNVINDSPSNIFMTDLFLRYSICFQCGPPDSLSPSSLADVVQI